jgi:glycerophosphoryl diester phosphodiesterase
MAPLSRPLIVGHRGCLYEELENTRAGFIKTAEMGADAVELDVFLLKCGTLVVFHGSGTDETPGLLKGYCVDRQESILEYTYEELQDIVVFNQDYAEFGCHASKIRAGVIPTLNQVLEDFKDTSMTIKIELKGAGTAEPVLHLVEEYGMQCQCHFSSFDLRQIAIIRALRPQLDENGSHRYKTGALFNTVGPDYLRRAQEVGASEVHLRYDECTSTRVREIHQAGMDSMAWFRGPVGMKRDVRDRFWDVGNEDHSMYKVVMQTGVRQMCVNRPDVILNMFTSS